MPHLFVNRQRRHGLGARLPDAHVRWEAVNAVLYVLGGLVFVVGSAFFFPALARWETLGVWSFIVGSLLYLVVTLHDALEVRHVQRFPETPAPRRQARLERVAAGAYLTGTVLFTLGSVLFLPTVDGQVAGAWCFVVGSLVFVLGAAVNVLHIVVARSLETMQLMNLTAVAFIVGAVLFTVASVPYLWSWNAAADERKVLAFVAAQYVAGSALFLLGGLFNAQRARLVVLQDAGGGNERG